MLRESPYKLGKHKESKRRRTNLLSNDKSSRPNLGKIGNQSPHNICDHPTQVMESKVKCGGLNKHVRSSATELKIFNEKDRGTIQSLSEASAQPAERIRRLSAVCEGWDKKMKRKRSVGTVGKRAMDNDFKRIEHSKLSSVSKLTSCDVQSLRVDNNQEVSSDNPSSLIKRKISKALRSGSLGVCSSDRKVMPVSMIRELPCSNSSSHPMAQWVGQRPQKISRTRRANVVAPIPNLDEVQNPSTAFSTPDFGTRNCSTGDKRSFASGDVDNPIQEHKTDLSNCSCSVQLPEVTRALGQEVKEEKQDLGDVSPIENCKVQGFVFPTKTKEALSDDDALENLGEAGRGLPLPRARTPRVVEKLENLPNTMSLENMKPKKNRSKSEREPTRKLSGRKASAYAGRMPSMGCARDADEVDVDREDLLAAAASARKAIYRACSSRFWKKMEPIFGPVSSHDQCYLKQQLSFAEKLEGCLSQISGAEYDILGILTHEEFDSGEKQGCYLYPVVDNDDPPIAGLSTGRRSIKASSLFQLVLSALIEDDESEGICNGNEGMGASIQCASDGSHCGSCNYADVEARDGDRLESEAESKEDFQMHKPCSGDRFSCTKSVSSNTTRNPNMSDSLYNNGRWQGEDILSHSDLEFVSGICQNNPGGSRPADLNLCRTPLSDCEYQLMGFDDRLILELQSIGLYPDPMPNLAEEEEVLDEDVKELKEGLHQQVAKKKMKLAKIDEAVQDVREREKQYIEQLAMNRLVEMAYKGRMVSRRNDGSRVMRKVSKQVTLGFISRTVARCRKFELTGESCFREPSLQDALFSVPEGKDEKSGVLGTENNTCLEAPKHQAEGRGSGSLGSGLTVRHAEYGFRECETAVLKGRKRNLLLDDGGSGASAQGAAACGSVLEGVKGKRSERDESHSSDVTRCKFAGGSSQQSVGSCKSDCKTNPKSKQRCSLTLSSAVTGMSPSPTSTQLQSVCCEERKLEIGSPSARDVTQNASMELKEPISVANLPGAGAGSDPIAELGLPNDLGENQDFSSWFDDERLQDYDSMGLEIPMDDISGLNMLF